MAMTRCQFESAIDDTLGQPEFEFGEDEEARLAITRAVRQIKASVIGVGADVKPDDELHLEGPAEIFDICDHVDENHNRYRVPKRLSSLTTRIRQSAQRALLRTHFDDLEDKAPAFDQGVARDQIDKDRQLAEVVSEMLPRLKQSDVPEGKDFNQHWIKKNCLGQADRLQRLLISPVTGVESWEAFKKMLPMSLREKIELKKETTLDKGMLEKLNEWKDIASRLGPEVVAQVLVKLGVVGKGGFNRAMRMISPYLGRCAVVPPDFDDAVRYPEVLLNIPEIEDLLFYKLRQTTYRRLAAVEEEMAQRGEMFTLDDYDEAMRRERKNIEALIMGERKAGESNGSVDEYGKLFERVLQYFEEDIRNVECPECLVDVLKTKSGEFPFPSLRQRVAMHEISQVRRMVIGFDMGLGKTEAAFAASEYTESKNMLYVSLGDDQPEKVAARISRKHGDPEMSCYRKDMDPTVGVIQSVGHKLTPEEVNEQVFRDKTIIPYSMLIAQTTEGVPIWQHIINECRKRGKPIDFLAYDEAHWARKHGRAFTEAIHQLSNQMPGLYENGCIVGLTGDLMPNNPEDLGAHMRLWDRDTYGQCKSVSQMLRTTHPIAIGAAIRKHYLELDEPKDWRSKLDIRRFPLHDRERAIYDALFETDEENVDRLLGRRVAEARGDCDDSGNTRLFQLYKQHLLPLIATNPSMCVRGKEVESAVFDNITAWCDEKLAETDADGDPYGAFLIAETACNEGIMRDVGRSEHASDRTLFRKIEAYLKEKYGDKVKLEIIDGSTKRTVRKRILSDSEKAAAAVKEEHEAQRVIVFAMSSIVREGRDLSHIHRALILEPEFNNPDLAQFVRRFWREGNNDVKVSLLVPDETVHVGKLESADSKSAVTCAVRNGGTFTTNDLALFDAEAIASGKKVHGVAVAEFSPLLHYIKSRVRKLGHILDYGAKGQDPAELELWFAERGPVFAELYCGQQGLETWELGHGGNNNRFIAGLIEQLEKEGIIKGVNVLDAACGPMGLEQTLGVGGVSGRVHKISSIDLCGEMLEAGIAALHEKCPEYRPHFVRKGSMHDLKAIDPSHFEDKTMDAVNCASALMWAKLGNKRMRPEKKKNSPRVKTLLEFNRVMKPGAVGIITFPYRRASGGDQFKNFVERALPAFGCRYLPEYSGIGTSVDMDDYGDPFQNMTATFVKDADVSPDAQSIRDLNLDYLDFTFDAKLSKGPSTGRPPRPRKIRDGFKHTDFAIQGVGFSFGTDPQQRAGQLERLRKVKEGVDLLRDLYVNNGYSFDGDAMVEELARRDISMTYFAIKGQEYHAFMLPGVEGEHVVPLDDFAWGPIPEPPEDEAVQAKKKNKTRTKKRNASRKKKDVSE